LFVLYINIRLSTQIIFCDSFYCEWQRMDYAIFPREFNHENFREARRSLDWLLVLVTHYSPFSRKIHSIKWESRNWIFPIYAVNFADLDLLEGMKASQKERIQNAHDPKRRESCKGKEIQRDGTRGKELSGTCNGPQVDAVRLWKQRECLIDLSLAPFLHFSHSPENEDATRIRRSTFLPLAGFAQHLLCLNQDFRQTFLAIFVLLSISIINI